MKLNECIEMGKACGLITLGEAYDNIDYHQTSLFVYAKMEKEMQELRNEIGKKYNLTEITDNINKILI